MSMKRLIVVLIVLIGAGVCIWFLTGGFGRTVEGRIEAELVARGLPEPMAECMAERMADRLTLTQLRKLEQLRAQEGEADIPLTMPDFLERVRRIGDNEVIEVTASSAAICAFSGS